MLRLKGLFTRAARSIPVKGIWLRLSPGCFKWIFVVVVIQLLNGFRERILRLHRQRAKEITGLLLLYRYRRRTQSEQWVWFEVRKNEHVIPGHAIARIRHDTATLLKLRKAASKGISLRLISKLVVVVARCFI